MPNRGPLDLAFMGTGNAFAPGRCWSGFVFNERHLFDVPPTALYSLKRMGISLPAVQTVFVSHFHADHFFGLPFLLLEFAYQTRRSADLTIIGPPGIEERTHRLVELAYPSLGTKDHGYRLCFREVEDGTEGSINGLQYEAVEVDHGGDALQCYGYRVASSARRIAYTGDTMLCDQLVRLADQAEVLVSDCTYPSGRSNPEHMSFDEVLDLKARIGSDTRILLTHLGEPVRSTDCAGISVANDLVRYSF